MLESLRAAQSTWVGRAVIGALFLLIIVGLSFFGIADLFRSYQGNWVAKVGGSEISVDAYRQAYQTNLQQMQQRLRRPITNVQARQMGLDQQVLSRLVTDAVLDEQARKLGLAISDPQIAKVITQDPTFAGQNGQFDHAKFTDLLRDNGMTEQSFVRDQRSAYLRQEIVDAVAGAMQSPKAAVEALHRLQNETRSIDMLVLPPTLVGTIPAPDAATLQKYYDDRKQLFAAPEYRKITMLAVSPAEVAKPDAVTDEELRKAYDSASDTRFGTPERRTLQQIVFPTQQDAEAAALRITSGTPFSAIAEERHVSGKDLELGTLTRASIFDKAIADAAFALPANGTSDPIKGTFGTVLVHVVNIEPGNRQSFEEVAPALRKELAEAPARTRDALRDIRDKVEDQRASGKTLTESAEATGLKVRTIDALDSAGRDKNGNPVDLPDRDAVLHAIFASDVGVDNDVIQSRSGDEIWFEVQNVEAAHQRSFDEVKPAVEAAWRKDETEKQLTAKADELLKSTAQGTSLSQIAASLGNLEIRHVDDLKRSGNGSVPQAVALKAFDTPIKGFAVADGDAGTRVLFQVLDSVTPPSDANPVEARQIGEQYGSLLAEDVLTAFLARQQGTVGIKINPQALSTAVGGTS